MDRLGLKHILADVQAGRVDVIVVYKVDRLTRALSDFAKIVDVLDAAGASFVSITQSFNTTTSMGRLTLNVLLSFAQFEREVISERVRDKVAASKRKGMWMGGNPPLGYDIQDRKLVINPAEAETLRFIMQRYVELGSVYDLVGELRAKGMCSKLHRSEDGATRGGKPLTAGPIYHMLSNQLYRGVVVHKGEAHPGQHEAIVSDELWEKVQHKLASNRVEHRQQSDARAPSLLAGMIRDGEGRRMTPSHASRRSTRYRYYVSVDEPGGPHPRPIRIAAAEIEHAVITSLVDVVDDQARLMAMFGEDAVEGLEAADLLMSAASLSMSIRTMTPPDQRALLLDLAMQVVIHAERVEASIDRASLGRRLGADTTATPDDRIDLAVPTIMVRRGADIRLTIQPDPLSRPSRRDPRLVELIVEAHEAKRMLGLDAKPPSVAPDLEYQKRNHLARLARLSFLAPEITRAILDGSRPAALSARRLLRVAELPIDWSRQRAMLGFV